MNIAKNMEAVFVAALVFAGSASFIANANAHVKAAVPVAIESNAAMPVVTVTAKRMTAEEKRASLIAERAAARSNA